MLYSTEKFFKRFSEIAFISGALRNKTGAKSRFEKGDLENDSLL